MTDEDLNGIEGIAALVGRVDGATRSERDLAGHLTALVAEVRSLRSAFDRQRDRAEAAAWAKGVAESEADRIGRNLERVACVVSAADRLAEAVDNEGMRRHSGMTPMAVRTKLELAVIDALRDFRQARERLARPPAFDDPNEVRRRWAARAGVVVLDLRDCVYRLCNELNLPLPSDVLREANDLLKMPGKPAKPTDEPGPAA